ncbi:MAG: nucleotide exchange factor GrpE [Nitrospirae bacterium]|nr:nucleotide exchange factor GrpE [Nitrospirota bacterium]
MKDNEENIQTGETPGETRTEAEAPTAGSLENEIRRKTDEYNALQNKYLRTLADMENLRKRMTRDQADAIRYANEKVFLEMIPVLDNIERAILHADEKKEFEPMLEGLRLTLREFLGVLEKFGVRPIESIGRPFDPARHHAVEQVISDAHEEGTVVAELRKGYFLNERTLRPALVSVSKRPEGGEKTE